MTDGIRVSLDVPEGLIAPESVNNQQATKQDANNYTSLPGALKSWNEYEDWLTYDNSEFRADLNFKECWADVDKLKEKFGRVWLININSGPVIRDEKDAKRYTFGFNFAIAGSNEIEIRKIKRLTDNYRTCGSNGTWTYGKAIKQIIPLMELIKSVPYVEDHFS